MSIRREDLPLPGPSQTPDLSPDVPDREVNPRPSESDPEVTINEPDERPDREPEDTPSKT